MHSSVNKLSVLQLLKLLGPGVLMATAAIGGSHLVASTQAGAKFGWQLAILVLLVNIFKYPFFRAGIEYTMNTGQTLQYGYLSLGKPYILLALGLNSISSVVNSAALLMFAASLLSYLLPVNLPISVLSGLTLAFILIILFSGQYRILNNVSKFIMVVLVIATLTATFIAFLNGPVAPQNFVSPSPWVIASVGFLVVTMGWMPAPIEISSITSMWLKRQRQEKEITKQAAFFDFNLGYFITMLLALVFLALGALVLHGSEQQLANGGVGFSKQLVDMYSSTIGEWSRWLIALVAFLCIFGSALTVLDGYSSVVAEAIALSKGQASHSHRLFVIVLTTVSVCSLAIILFFKAALLPMLGFAMTLAFMTTPVFAFLNHKLASSEVIEVSNRKQKWLNVLSYLGLFYLFGFLLLFVVWKWFL